MPVSFGKRGTVTSTSHAPKKSGLKIKSDTDRKTIPYNAIGLVGVCVLLVWGAAVGLLLTPSKSEVASVNGNIGTTQERVALNTLQETQSVRAAQDQAYPTSLIMSYCHDKWGADRTMRSYCEDEQQGAMETAQKESFSHKVRVTCAAEWPIDWKMYLYCARRETNAATPVHELPLEPSDRVEEHCQHEWPDNYTMRADCEKLEFEARAEVSHLRVQDHVAKHCAAEWPENWRMYKGCVERDATTR
jgi:hypothetical protein